MDVVPDSHRLLAKWAADIIHKGILERLGFKV